MLREQNAKMAKVKNNFFITERLEGYRIPYFESRVVSYRVLAIGVAIRRIGESISAINRYILFVFECYG